MPTVATSVVAGFAIRQANSASFGATIPHQSVDLAPEGIQYSLTPHGILI